MPRLCQICRHAKRTEIEHTLVSKTESQGDIAKQYRVSQSVLSRHYAHHVIKPGSGSPGLRSFVAEYRYLESALPAVSPELLVEIVQRHEVTE